MNSHALNVLEYREALDLVARFAGSALGADAVRALAPSADLGWIEPELERVEEMQGFLGGDQGWHLPAIPDVRDPLRKLRVEGSVLEGAHLRDIATLLASSRTARRAVLGQAERYPLLAMMAGGLVEAEKTEAQIGRALDDHGNVRDDASPALSKLRREIKGARGRLVERLAAYMASLPPHFQVSDASVTVREGRYVIPVRREGRGEVGGIVHDESATGATLFVEPPLAVELMNRLRELEAEEAREVLRILRELTGTVRPLQPELLTALDVLVALDALYARARYAARVDGHRPRLLPPGTEEYEVIRGFHPILQARAQGSVVPFDLRMEPGERTLLISGPNTGGKTVLLKAIGLISLLAQSGIVPPVDVGTRLPVFREVFADIGDEQSIEASLSTFSAHLKNLREALEGAAWESLVLTDEIGSGTDPVEGGALATAVLVELTRRSCFTVATTHLGQLKLLAAEERGIVNASLQFDADRLQPTYRLVKGVPGRSYGLAIARRLGLPGGVLSHAESALPEGERDVGKLLLELEAKEQRLEAQSLAYERQSAEVERLKAELEDRDRELKVRERDAERRARQQARDLLLKSRAEVEAAIAEVRGAADEAALQEAARAARRRVEEAAKKQREKTPAERRAAGRERGKAAPRREALELAPGLRVRIESLGRTGTVVEVRDGKAMVEAGSMRLLLPREDLSPLPAGDQQAERKKPAGGYYVHTVDARPEVDLRGMRVEEIATTLGRAIDDAILSGLPSFRIIHGKGTGALRAHVRDLLQKDRRIVTARTGELFEGGTGVTVVEFA